ncbi:MULTISPECIES: cell division protein ZapA [Celeribacter]|jgi:cell division protein ZapA|uniref:Cell division protein ZapA n=1 Tax=Celeribacter halophilus TaxID=576117 RepID=A0A1I3NVR1_9RHOB|nr:cell division protein ZapA [Celeribacter halophilus]MDO6457622.1 cell division protein ZapA [Celeribacter halophilus]MDO6722320.1 cell division protein ZapA [Celeribacter halophilus]PZX14662.1 cell division protein ZapA [Celeribacter halophilus]SFJ13363.1 cell division protein ZapA [Celeribacter halophilus]
MPEVKISIGGREFEVACQAGEEHFLKAAAQLLDNEASVLSSQIGRLPAERMLLMAGLMLADKTAGMEEQMRNLESKLGAQEALIEEMRARPEPEPQKIEVPVVPGEVMDSLAEMAARAESMAAAFEERLGVTDTFED